MKRRRKKTKTESGRPGTAADPPPQAGRQRARNPQSEERRSEKHWKHLPLVLALAFVARVATALSGDFILHPDEMLQYLEPAHRLVFGNGIVLWEYFYGARSWLVPGAIAGLLKLFDLSGLGHPAWYVGGVKIAFCAVSLLIPAGMYFFARRHFSETAARAALLGGAFWYELVAFAHKPMTEFVASSLLIALLGLCAGSFRRGNSGADAAADADWRLWLAAFLAVLTAAIRMQYAPIALLALAAVFLRTGKKIRLAFAAMVFFLLVGLFDAATWDAGIFHSYIVNFRVNTALGELRAGESPAHQFLLWLGLGGAGLSLVFIAAAFGKLRRYWFLVALTALTLLSHSFQSHKEYRFIFVVVPIWLLIGSDIITRVADSKARPRRIMRLAAAMFAAVTLAGLLNALPYQNKVYHNYSQVGFSNGFIRNQDPIFAAYSYLARAPGVKAVWQADRRYPTTPSYYYLHRKIPFYAEDLPVPGERLKPRASSMVSHVVTQNPEFSIPGYSLEREFGDIRVLSRIRNELPVRHWKSYSPTFIGESVYTVVTRIYADAPPPPVGFGVPEASVP